MKIEINARKREAQGTGASRRLRRAGAVPGIVYGGSKDAVTIELNHKELYQHLTNEKFHASILSLKLDGAAEDRSRTDGWEIPAFWASPTAIGDVVYFTTTLGLVYAFDANAEVLDAKALLSVNDLGPLGETWAMGNLAFADGRIYHRTAKQLLCIGDHE